LAQAADGGLWFVSGTSFSAPNMSGGAALLREADPDASAQAIRDALVHTSNMFEIPGANPIDQGSGVVDYVAALGYLPDADDGHKKGKKGKKGKGPRSKVKDNIRAVGIKTLKLKGRSKTMSVNDLVPGEVAHFFIESSDKTDALRFEFSNITPALPPAEQNLVYGDDLFIKIQDALTSDEATVFSGFVASDGAVDIVNPQTGIVRVAIMGDWTNAGSISADLTITEAKNHQGKETARGKVEQGEMDSVTVDVPIGAVEVVFELAWKENWGHYPTNDLDMILLGPPGLIWDGATLNSPERVVLDAPAGGAWTVFVDGFTIHDGSKHGHAHDHHKAESKWELRVTADGVRIK